MESELKPATIDGKPCVAMARVTQEQIPVGEDLFLPGLKRWDGEAAFISDDLPDLGSGWYYYRGPVIDENGVEREALGEVWFTSGYGVAEVTSVAGAEWAEFTQSAPTTVSFVGTGAPRYLD